jgi:formylmethanofuran dehydrogenase subunit D
MIMPKLKVTLLTGRTLRQGQGKEYGKLSDLYQKSVSICEIDPEDMQKLGVKDGENVKITTDFGSVILKAVKSRRTPHWGIIFVPYGPWASAIVNPKTDGIGMPSFKGIDAYIEPAPLEPVLQFRELITKEFGKE